MNKEAIEEWVQILKLPEMQDKQTTGRLGTADGKRCCLGVLCDLAAKKGIIPPPIIGSDLDNLCYDGAEVVLPHSVQEWIGLRTDNGSTRIEDDSPGIVLTEKNDDGWSFADIADLIERYKDKLFV